MEQSNGINIKVSTEIQQSVLYNAILKHFDQIKLPDTSIQHNRNINWTPIG